MYHMCSITIVIILVGSKIHIDRLKNEWVKSVTGLYSLSGKDVILKLKMYCVSGEEPDVWEEPVGESRWEYQS